MLVYLVQTLQVISVVLQHEMLEHSEQTAVVCSSGRWVVQCVLSSSLTPPSV